MRTSRRGFTLIELALAAVLGAFIIGAVFGLLVVLRASETRSRMQAEALSELANLQAALERSFSTLVVLEEPPRLPNARRENVARPVGESPTPEPETDPDAPVDPPRLILEQYEDAPLPRLELVTATAPVMVKLAEGTPAFVEPEDGGGVRGAFELQPGDREGTIEVWFRAYDLGAPPGDRTPIGQARVCKDLVSLDIKFWKSPAKAGEEDRSEPAPWKHDDGEGIYWLGPMPAGQWRDLPPDGDDRWADIPAARSFVHLPAYIEVEAETWQGVRGRWFFEVKWLIARAPESLRSLVSSTDGVGRTGTGDASRAGGRGSRTSGSTKGGESGGTIEVFGPDGRPR